MIDNKQFRTELNDSLTENRGKILIVFGNQDALTSWKVTTIHRIFLLNCPISIKFRSRS